MPEQELNRAAPQSRNPSRQLGLFAKYWQSGKVKTRLAATLGEAAACDVYRALVFDLLTRLAESGDQRCVVLSPVECLDRCESELRAAGCWTQPQPSLAVSTMPGRGWQLTPQSSGDLGERMRNFFDACFVQVIPPQVAAQNRADRLVVVIGADCPAVTPELVEQAFARLQTCDVVIGPSTDGGYYLLGMRNQTSEIFEGIGWSTPQVLSQTLERLTQQQLSVELLPEQTDIDQLADLREFWRCLQRQREADKLTDHAQTLWQTIARSLGASLP